MAGYVYLIGTSKFQWYKIGKSKNASIRVRELGILLPFKIEVIAVWKADNHHALESLLHEKYAENRINGEWFRFGVANVRGICNEMAFAQVKVAADFTNIEKDCKQDSDKYLTVVRPPGAGAYRGTKGGAKYKLDNLIRENAELRRKLQELSVA